MGSSCTLYILFPLLALVILCLGTRSGYAQLCTAGPPEDVSVVEGAIELRKRLITCAVALVIGFLGRMDEPRKGLPILLQAFRQLAADRPGLRLLIAGRGEAQELDQLPAAIRERVVLLGEEVRWWPDWCVVGCARGDRPWAPSRRPHSNP